MATWNFIPIMAEGYRIAEVQPNDAPMFDGVLTDTDRANARLIAIAPDMFELLKEASEILWKDGHNGTARRIDAIISKADPDEKGEL